MTKFLSHCLQAPEPFFRSGLQRLEAANGHPNTDIRFSIETKQAAQAKLRELGLDPRDTTNRELYGALQARMQADDALLTRKLRTLAATHVSAEADVVAGMTHALQALTDDTQYFALKGSSLRALLKKLPPKKAMKQLGYRSLDSFLKHETPTSALAAAWLSESVTWQQRLRDQYKRLTPRDFETRQIQLIHPRAVRWQALAEKSVADTKQNLLYFKELGAIVLLPLPAEAPIGSVTASLTLALHALNEMRAASTFLELCQVRADFGEVVQTVATNEPQLNSRLFDQPMPWQLIQRHYARQQAETPTSTEPHWQLSNIVWQPIERALSAIEPSFTFWHDTAHLGLLDGQQAISFNVVDAALNLCNRLPFEKQVTHYFRRSLWHELLLRYLQPAAIEHAIANELQPQLAAEMAVA